MKTRLNHTVLALLVVCLSLTALGPDVHTKPRRRKSKPNTTIQPQDIKKLLDKGKASKAHRLLSAAIERHPQNAMLHYLRARTEVQINTLKAAEAALIFALRYGGARFAQRATGERDLIPLRKGGRLKMLLDASGLPLAEAEDVRTALKTGKSPKNSTHPPQLTDIDDDGQKEAFIYAPAAGKDGAWDLLGLTLDGKVLHLTQVARVPGDVDRHRVGIGLTHGKLALVSWYVSEGDKADAHTFAVRVNKGRVEVLKDWHFPLESPCRAKHCKGKARRMQATLWLADVLGDKRAEVVVVRHICEQRETRTAIFALKRGALVKKKPRALKRALAARRKQALSGDTKVARWLLSMFPASLPLRRAALVAIAKQAALDGDTSALEDQLLEAHRYATKRDWKRLLKALRKKMPKLVKMARKLVKEEATSCNDSYQEKLLAPLKSKTDNPTSTKTK
ncbi:MAG: hypothetical protein JRH20_20400 [Deltaproteobacteria bacterium]|nr:hypothetical protein [Deltaproteobacteria bacterium]